jgi:hypothetical protein
VQGEGGCPLGPQQGALLALRPLAAVQLGELAAAGLAQLPPLRRAALLGSQPQECRLQRVRDANVCPLASRRKTAVGPMKCERTPTIFGAENGHVDVEMRLSAL